MLVNNEIHAKYYRELKKMREADICVEVITYPSFSPCPDKVQWEVLLLYCAKIIVYKCLQIPVVVQTIHKYLVLFLGSNFRCITSSELVKN